MYKEKPPLLKSNLKVVFAYLIALAINYIYFVSKNTITILLISFTSLT